MVDGDVPLLVELAHADLEFRLAEQVSLRASKNTCAKFPLLIDVGRHVVDLADRVACSSPAW